MADNRKRKIYAKMREMQVGETILAWNGDAESSRPFRQIATYLRNTFGVVFAVHYDWTTKETTITRTK